MKMIEKRLSGETIFEGHVVKLVKDKVLCPNGNESFREIVRHNGGAAVLCINENEEILLVKQFRYAYDEVMYEIPAGKLEKNEDPLLAAKRELEEETGNKAESLDFLGAIYPTCGYSSEIIYLYLARNCKKTQTHFDDDEVIESKFYKLDDVKNMILNGEIKDAKTICALSYYLMRK